MSERNRSGTKPKVAHAGRDILSDFTTSTPIRWHDSKVLFFDRKASGVLTPFGWFSVLCIAALLIGAMSALGT
jgi:hypothetical protein